MSMHRVHEQLFMNGSGTWNGPIHEKFMNFSRHRVHELFINMSMHRVHEQFKSGSWTWNGPINEASTVYEHCMNTTDK